ncbi:hypothetical protein HF086_005676 [Spodoptera exigua]|uniref:alkaline phosphatase n=1 Tax=Spodoptera exigua TaxID=7107 RepID=A0A922MYL2_SPOEX|nr:hypothetical protein HF086_005676 [Spodoptera exigua]
MGGGRQQLVSNATGTEHDPISLSPWTCYRQDGRNLIEQYKTDKSTRGLKHSVIMNNKELAELDVSNTDYLLGIFSNEHLSYEHERNKGPEGMPSLSEMVGAAIKVLQKNKNGYFLMVEGGNLDMAHHRGWAKIAVNEALAMEEAVQLAADMTDAEDTLLIVTSDHTHSMSINGYPDRGSSPYSHLFHNVHEQHYVFHAISHAAKLGV